MPSESAGSLPHAQPRQAPARQAALQPAPSQQARAGKGPPAQQTPLAALWRTRESLRSYLWLLALMLAAAVGAAGAEIAIPLLVKAVIDGPIAHGDTRALIPLGLAATGLGVTQAALSLYRRWVQASAVTGMERSVRDRPHAHLQRLPPRVPHELHSGPPLSRATTDLSAIRRFAGFGIIFFITNV